MAFSPITVTGKWEGPGGAAAAGLVRFRLNATMRDAVSNTTVSSMDQAAVLNASGQISLALLATNDPTTAPTGVTYHVREEIAGAAIAEYDVVVPYNAPGGTIDLADLAQVNGGIAVLNPLTGLGHGMYWAADNGFVAGASDSVTRAANSAAWDAFWARTDVTPTYRTITFTDVTSGSVTRNSGLTAGGATLVFGPGEWWFNDLTTPLGPFQCLEGMGKHLTTLRITSATGKLRMATNASSQSLGGWIKDLTVDGRDANGVNSATTLIKVGICAECTIENVQFIGKAANAVNAYGAAVKSSTTQEAALVLAGTQNMNVRNCLFNTISGTAVLLDEGAGKVTLDDCFWSGCTEDLRAGTATGQQGTGANNCVVRGGIMERDTYAHNKVFSIVLQSFDSFLIDNVIFALSLCPAGHASVSGQSRYPAIICVANELGVATQEKLIIRDCLLTGPTAASDNGTVMLYATSDTLGLTGATGNLSGATSKYVIVFEGANWPSGLSWGVVVNSAVEVLIVANGIVNLTGIKSGNEWSTITGATANGWSAVANGWQINAKAMFNAGSLLLGKRDTGTIIDSRRFRGFMTYPGNPNGALVAPSGSICIDSTAALGNGIYYNTSVVGTPANTWTAITLP